MYRARLRPVDLQLHVFYGLRGLDVNRERSSFGLEVRLDVKSPDFHDEWWSAVDKDGTVQQWHRGCYNSYLLQYPRTPLLCCINPCTLQTCPLFVKIPLEQKRRGYVYVPPRSI
jgi:hypothetical protein